MRMREDRSEEEGAGPNRGCFDKLSMPELKVGRSYSSLPVCPSARLPVCPSARLPVCPSARLPVCKMRGRSEERPLASRTISRVLYPGRNRDGGHPSATPVARSL